MSCVDAKNKQTNKFNSDVTLIAIKIPLFTCCSDMSRMEVIAFDRMLTIYAVFSFPQGFTLSHGY